MGQTTKSNIQLVGVVILLCAILIGMGWLLGSGNVLAVDMAALEAAEESAPPAAAETPAPADEALLVTEQVERAATRLNQRGMQPVTRTVPVGLETQSAADTKECTFVPVYVDGTFGGYSYLVDNTAYLSIPDFCGMINEDCTEPEQASGQIHLTAAGAPIEISVNADHFTANGRYVKLSHRTLALDGKLLVDLEALQHIFGTQLAYDSENAAVTVDTATKQLLEDGESFYNSHEIYWLSRIIYAEANGQPFDGMIGVGNVVLNRVASARYPNSVEGVVFDPGQFTPVDNGSIYNTPSSEAVLAAQMCLEGVNTVGGCMFFLNPSIADASWFNSARTYYTTIGGHAFYI